MRHLQTVLSFMVVHRVKFSHRPALLDRARFIEKPSRRPSELTSGLSSETALHDIAVWQMLEGMKYQEQFGHIPLALGTIESEATPFRTCCSRLHANRTLVVEIVNF